MSIYIRGMEMPKDGTFNIVYIYSDGHVAMPFWGKGMQIVQDIEAVPVPEHGRLVDADALYPIYADLLDGGDVKAVVPKIVIDTSPTVIPADPPKDLIDRDAYEYSGDLMDEPVSDSYKLYRDDGET